MGSNGHLLDDLVKLAEKSARPTAIIALGLINFESFFHAREAAEREHNRNSERYPLVELGVKHFESMLPKYRAEMIELAREFNGAIEECVRAMNTGQSTSVRVVYSAELAHVDIGKESYLSPVDAWHPSRAGHQVLAAAVWRAVAPELSWLRASGCSTPHSRPRGIRGAQTPPIAADLGGAPPNR